MRTVGYDQFCTSSPANTQVEVTRTLLRRWLSDALQREFDRSLGCAQLS